MTQAETWVDRAKCRPGSVYAVDPEYFFPINEGVEAERTVYCDDCPVRSECLAFALNKIKSVDGIFGGTTGAERALIIRARNRAVREARKAAQVAAAG